MRPTIPLSEWRIAIDLAATKAIQNQPGTPAHGCECDQCLLWENTFSSVLPSLLLEQLRRVGISPEKPTDLYWSDKNDIGAHCRITFHIAGKILSGPNAWIDTELYGPQINYLELSNSPKFLLLAAFPHKGTLYQAPKLPAGSNSDLIQVDLRALVPWSANSKSEVRANK
jgi:hypothetical protein